MFLKGIELTLDNNRHVELLANHLENLDITLDSNESMFFARQLLQMEEKIYKELFVNNEAMSMIPVDTSGGSGLESVGWREGKQFGKAKWMGQDDGKPPVVGRSAIEVTEPVRTFEASYEYTFMDIRKASRLGMNLSAEGLEDVRLAMSQFLDDVILFGDDNVDVKGIFTTAYKSAYNTVTLPADGTGSSAKITAKNYDLAVRDMKNILSKTFIQSKGVFKVDRCYMSIDIFEYLRGLEKANTDMTALEKLQKLYPNVIFEAKAKLGGTAPSNKDYILALPSMPNVIKAKVPNVFEQLPTDKTAKVFSTTCISEVSSVQVRYPKAITLVEN